jgi:Flp pilus assembly protein CpaB
MSFANLRDGNVKVAIALAAVAAVLTMIYVAHSSSGSTDSASAAANGVTVLVAKRDIPIGTGGSALLAGGYVKAVKLAPETIAPGAVTNGKALAGLVAVQPIFAGEQLDVRAFGKSGASGALSGLSGTGRVMELSGDPRQLLVGVVQPGDHVDVTASLKSQQGMPYGKIVLRDLLVTGISAAGASSLGQNSDWVTLRLTDAQARKLFFVAQNGNWSLILRPLNHPSSSSDATSSLGSVLAGRS